MRYKYHIASQYHGYRVDKADPFAFLAEPVFYGHFAIFERNLRRMRAPQAHLIFVAADAEARAAGDRLLGGADDRGQDHDGQRQRARQQAPTHLQHDHEEDEAEQAEDD